jgi:hypothetical protein
MKRIILCALLALDSCNAPISDEARTSVVGMTLPDLLSCAGRPDKTIQAGPEDWIVQYEQNQAVQPPFTLKSAFVVSGELDIGARGMCHAVFRVHRGYVAAVHFTGPSLTASGANGACVPLIRECVTRADHTTLPQGYQVGDWLHD